jgi:hypothetical protein
MDVRYSTKLAGEVWRREVVLAAVPEHSQLEIGPLLSCQPVQLA